MMRANLFTAAFATVSYLYALLSLTSYWAFLIPTKSLPSFLEGIVLYSIDTANSNDSSTIRSIMIDIGLILLFSIPHSTLARETTKKLLKLPISIERPLFVFQSAALLHAQMHYWHNFQAPPVWDVSNYVTTPIYALFGAGFLFLVSASFALDHFHLFGLSQGMGMDINKRVGLAPQQKRNKLVARWHYAIVAHPIMTGILTFLWATPVMTMPHLLLSTANTIYILAAVILLEEPSLKNEIGQEYSDYLETVPRFCPMASKTKKEVSAADISLCPHFRNKKLAAPSSQLAVFSKAIAQNSSSDRAKAA